MPPAQMNNGVKRNKVAGNQKSKRPGARPMPLTLQLLGGWWVGQQPHGHRLAVDHFGGRNATTSHHRGRKETDRGSAIISERESASRKSISEIFLGDT